MKKIKKAHKAVNKLGGGKLRIIRVGIDASQELENLMMPSFVETTPEKIQRFHPGGGMIVRYFNPQYLIFEGVLYIVKRLEHYPDPSEFMIVYEKEIDTSVLKVVEEEESRGYMILKAPLSEDYSEYESRDMSKTFKIGERSCWLHRIVKKKRTQLLYVSYDRYDNRLSDKFFPKTKKKKKK